MSCASAARLDKRQIKRQKSKAKVKRQKSKVTRAAESALVTTPWTRTCPLLKHFCLLTFDFCLLTCLFPPMALNPSGLLDCGHDSKDHRFALVPLGLPARSRRPD